METYRRDRSYYWNYRNGPRYAGPYPRVPRVPTKECFTFRVNSRLGVAAGILLNSRWVECYSRLGFDILTYKTVRSAFRPCYPLPNWVVVKPPADGVLRGDPRLRVARRRPYRVADVTSAVCFGMPSMAPDVWRRDVREARRKLRRGQILVVSVVGTPLAGGGADELEEDFARCARWAAASGAHVVEANFSCPNVCTPEGSVYQDPALSRRLAAAIRSALPSTPFFIKCGHFDRGRDLNAFYRAVAVAADAVVLVNGVSRRVVGLDGKSPFKGFSRVGILGRSIHPAAVDSVRRAVRTVRRQGLPLGTVAVGGVMADDDPADFFDAGADAVMLGGAPMLDPHLAIRMKRRHPDW